MQQEYYELQITPNHKQDIFSNFIFEFGIEAIEQKGDTIVVRSEESLEEIEWGVKEFGKKLSEVFKEKIEVKTKLCKKRNEDWIKKYKSSITPIKVSDFYIHPTWEDNKEGFINILIDPALSFGTGHHETTSSCLELLDKSIKKDDEFLDVGCGSGILSIAACKLGARVELCDSDEQSIQSAKNNFKLNECSYQDIWVGSANKAKKQYDVVVANIVADVLIMISKDLKKCVKKDGNLILSGILDKYLYSVLAKFNDFKKVNIIEKNEWRTLQLKKIQW